MPDSHDDTNTDTGGTDTGGTDGSDGTNTDTTDNTDTGGDAGDGLGDAGERALASERKARKAAEKAQRAAEARVAELERQGQTDQERAVTDAREQARREALGEVNARLVAAEVRARAAGKLANPELAARLLDLDQFVPSDGEDIDGDAIGAAIDELVTAEPYLAASPATGDDDTGNDDPPPKRGTVPAGARGDNPVTFSRSQLRDPSFYAANRDAILKAASEGRITND